MEVDGCGNSLRVEDLIRQGKLIVGDGYRAKNTELGDTGLPFARAGNIDGGFNFEGADLFPEADLAKVGGKASLPGDVVFTSKGTVGRFAFVKPETPQFVYSPQLCYWRSLDPTLIQPRFLYYWMHGTEFLDQIDAVKGQTDMADYVSLTDQRMMKICVPPIPQQDRISEVLGALDDKIELNRKMNRTLKELAHSLFRSWFVDFDPVVAKREGRRPVGVPEAALPLFPEHFEDSRVGPIPQGWKVSTIGAEVTVVGGSTPRTEEPRFWGGKIHWVTPRDLSKLSDPVVLSSDRTITTEGLAEISSGLLPAKTVLLSSRAPIGYLAISEIPLAINQGFIAMICNKTISPCFALNWTQAFMEEILSRAGGTTFAEISKTNFRPIPLVMPSPLLICAFDALAVPWFDQIVSNVLENRALATLRDALLDPLLSGELSLKDAENAVAASLLQRGGERGSLKAPGPRWKQPSNS